MDWFDKRLEPTKAQGDVQGIRFWKEFPLNDVEQEKIARHFIDIYKRCSNSGMRSGWIDKVRKLKDVYDQKREKVNCFINDWTFLHVPIPTMIVDKAKDNIFNALNSERIINAKGIDIVDKKWDEPASNFLNYVLSKKSKFIESVDSANLDVMLTGVGYVETPWVTKTYSRFAQTETGAYEMRDFAEDYPDIRYLSPESVILTPDARFNGIQDCSAIFIERKFLYSDLQEDVKDGVYLNIDKSSITPPSETSTTGDNEVLVKAEAKREGIDEMAVPSEGHETVKIVEVWAKFKYKNLKQTDWRFWVTPINNKIVRWHASTSVIRPIVRLSVEPLRDSLYPRGLMEKMDNLSIEIDTIMNQILQVQAFSILPPMFVDENCGFDAKNFVWEASSIISIRDPNSNIRFANMPNSIPEAMQLYGQLFQLMQSLTSMSDYLLGGGGNETATGVNALTRSAIAVLQAMMGRLAHGYSEIARNVFIMIQQFAQMPYFTKIDPKNAEGLYAKLKVPIEDISGQWDFNFVPELVQSHEVKRREYNQFMQMVFPILIQYPDGSMPESLFYLMKEAFIVNGFESLVEEVLGPKRGCDVGSMTGFPPEAVVLLMVNGQYPKPSASEDHEAYLNAMRDFMVTDVYAEIPERNKGLFTRQIQERQQLMQNMARIDMAAQGQMQVPNMSAPGANNAVPMPEGQAQRNMESVNGRLEEQIASRLG